MKKYLQDLYNDCKTQFVQAIEREVRANYDKITFSPNIHIDLPRDEDDFFEDITEIEFNSKENRCYVHNYFTEIDLMTNEYWTPLRDMSFYELHKIAERL